MTQEQEIKAWALAISLLIGKPDVKATIEGTLEFSPEFWTLVKAVEKYISVPPKGDQILHG